MPKVACPPEQVYDKSKKKCVDIGSENYKNTLSKNPNAFKAYQKKIEKFLTVKTCKPGELYYKPTKRCVKVGGPTFKKYMKTNPNGFVTVSTKTPPKAKTPSPPPKTKTPPKIKTPPKAKTPPKTKTPPKALVSSPPKKKCKDNEVYYAPTKRCIKVGGQAHKKYMKINPSAFGINEKRVLTPTPEMKMVSNKAKKLFMFKVSKMLRAVKNTKEEEVREKLNKNNSITLPKHILVRQERIVHIPFTRYFPTSKYEINASSFNKNTKKRRGNERLVINTDNFFDKVYRYALKSFTNPNIIDLKWYKDVTEYYKKLQPLELYTIWAYTNKGDVYLNLWERKLPIDYARIDMSVFLYEIIEYLGIPGFPRDIFKTSYEYFSTDYMRYRKMKSADVYKFWTVLQNSPSERFKPSFIDTLLGMMSRRLSGLIRKAPMTKETMVVYRGVKDNFFTADDFKKKPNVNEVFINKGFVSTSLVPMVARDFTGGSCCFKVITILPGTKCLSLYGLSQFSEHELLLNKNTKYIIRDKYVAHLPNNIKNSYQVNVGTQDIKMTDIVIG